MNSLPLVLQQKRRRGFSLVEMMVVVVILGILTGIALVTFGNIKERAYTAVMQNDLRNFATARALYVSNQTEFSQEFTEIPNFALSPQVNLVFYESRGANEWSLRLEHDLSEVQCVIHSSAEHLNQIKCGKIGKISFSSQVTGANVHLDMSDNLSPYTVENIAWQFGDESTVVGPSKQLQSIQHTYDLPGLYTVRVIVLLSTGETLSGESVVNIEYTTPIASFSVNPSELLALDPVLFDGSASRNPGFSPLTYFWEMGDGGTRTDAKPVYRYNSPGEYDVKLRVVAENGRSHTAVKTLSVGDPTPGRIVFQSARIGSGKIFIMNEDGSNQLPLTTGAGVDLYPRWSPDGTEISFTSNRSGRNEIWLMNADGSDQRKLTTIGGAYSSWSPDGSKLLFHSEESGKWAIWIINKDDPDSAQQLTFPEVQDQFADWSPRGDYILFSSAVNSNWEIVRINADGSDRRQLTDNTVLDGGGAWSPDGTRIVFHSRRSGDDEIWLMDADGSNPIQLTDIPTSDFNPRFDRSGTRILFAGYRPGNRDLFSMNLDGSGILRLTTDPKADNYGDSR